MATENTLANSIVNGTEKQKKSRGIDMRFYWVRNRIHGGTYKTENINRKKYALVLKYIATHPDTVT